MNSPSGLKPSPTIKHVFRKEEDLIPPTRRFFICEKLGYIHNVFASNTSIDFFEVFSQKSQYLREIPNEIARFSGKYRLFEEFFQK